MPVTFLEHKFRAVSQALPLPERHKAVSCPLLPNTAHFVTVLRSEMHASIERSSAQARIEDACLLWRLPDRDCCGVTTLVEELFSTSQLISFQIWFGAELGASGFLRCDPEYPGKRNSHCPANR
jgi:hypothetical protein